MIEVRQNSDGSIDEVVADLASVHLEHLGGGTWCLRLEAGGERPAAVTLNIRPRRTHVYEATGHVEIRVTDVIQMQKEGS